VKRARARIARAIDKWLDVVEESSGGGDNDDTEAGTFRSVGGGEMGAVVAR
jgi:hypothetical protein